jgi:3-dehydroquinate synthase
MRCSRIKADIVSLDEREEKGIRTILNFGHTIGHAVEAAGGFKGYNHGEAVALGMLVAARISKKMGLTNCLTFSRLENLLVNVGLPTIIKKVSPANIIKLHYHDKKFSGPHNKFVLISGIGRTRIVKNVALAVIKAGFR